MVRRFLLVVGLAGSGLLAPEAVLGQTLVPVPSGSETPSLQAEVESSATLAEVLPNPRRLHPEVLSGLPLDDGLLGPRGRELTDLSDRIEAERLSVEWAIAEQSLRTRTVATGRADQDRARQRLNSATSDRARKESNLTRVSIDAFVNGSDEPDLAAILTAETANAASRATQELRSEHLADAAIADLEQQRSTAVEVEATEQRTLTQATRQLEREQGLLDVAVQTQTDAELQLAALSPQLEPARQRFEDELLGQTLPGTNNLQIVAVNAYYNASRIAFDRWPGCRVAWHQLAGVGRVESFHGNFGASSIDTDGLTSPRILGPQLNGETWLAIGDSDGGELDGDTEWDRAVGPMQFIPTSWALFAADGNGDGTADPHNLYDAAVAAADHLCGSDLDDTGRFQTALLGYNRSVQYGFDVMGFANRYADLLEIADPWEPPETTSSETVDPSDQSIPDG